MKKLNLLAAMMLMASGSVMAQEPEPPEGPEPDGNGFAISFDLTSKALWRGGYCGGAAIQPDITYSVGGFFVEAWNSSDLNFSSDGYEEIDWTIGYGIAGASVSLTDYCWNNADGNFVYFGPYKENHFLELGVGYDFGELTDVPLSLSVNTMLAGANLKSEDEQGHSTYIELSYSPTLPHEVDLSLSLGAAVENEESLMYSSKDGFNIVNVDLSVSKTFPIKHFGTFAPKAEIMCNPVGFEGHGDVYFVAGVGFAF